MTSSPSPVSPKHIDVGSSSMWGRDRTSPIPAHCDAPHPNSLCAAPLTGRRVFVEAARSRPRANGTWLGGARFWVLVEDVIGALSLFATLYLLLFIGAVVS